MSFEYSKDKMYIVKVDNEICGYVKNKVDAVMCVELLSDKIEAQSREKKPYRKFFQEKNVKVNNTISIHSYKPGTFFDGSLGVVSTISFGEVKKMYYVDEVKNEVPDEENEDEVPDDEVPEDQVPECGPAEANDEVEVSDSDSSENTVDDDSDYSEEYSSDDEPEFFSSKRTPLKHIPFLFPPPPKILKYMVAE